jgi:hypothetical protein
MPDNVIKGEEFVGQVIGKMAARSGICWGVRPGPDPDTISQLTLGYSDTPNSGNTARDTRVRLVPAIRNGEAVIDVEQVNPI